MVNDPEPALTRVPWLAGWLFADMLLVLFLVGLSLAPGRTHPPPREPEQADQPPPEEPLVDRVLNEEPGEFYVRDLPMGQFTGGSPPAGAVDRLLEGTDTGPHVLDIDP